MRIHVEHDAVQLATLTDSPRPSWDGLILRLGDPGAPPTCVMRGNVLGDQWLFDASAPGQRILTWSGSLAGDLETLHPPNWMSPGARGLDEFCSEVGPQLRRHGRTLCFQPHSRHVLSDAQACLAFLRRHEDEPFEVALSPATMFEPAMLPDAEDHLTRQFQALANRSAMIMLADLKIAGEGDSLRCETVPLGDGVLPRATVLSLLRSEVSPETPVVIAGAKLDQQLAWLEPA